MGCCISSPRTGWSKRAGPSPIPRKSYLKRLYQAHRLHHAVDGKDGCVSFGFIYAPPVTKLVKELDRNRKAQPSGAEVKPVAADGDGAAPR